VCVGKAGISLPVKVRSGQSRADRPAASLAGVVATRGPKRRQQVHGIYGSNPEKWACRGGRAGNRTSEGSMADLGMREDGCSAGG
jgi:hypothetical protein